MRVVHKYELSMSGDTKLEMPAEAEILTVENQFGKLVLWALVDPRHSLRKRHIRVLCTGEPIDDIGMDYIGTAIFNDDTFVLHVFEMNLLYEYEP